MKLMNIMDGVMAVICLCAIVFTGIQQSWIAMLWALNCLLWVGIANTRGGMFHEFIKEVQDRLQHLR